MIALFVVVAIAVIGGVAVLVSRDRPLIADDPVGSRALEWSGGPEVTAEDLGGVRFTVALRGYRMEEVDRVLDDTRAALSERDARIAELQRVVAALGSAPAADDGDAVDVPISSGPAESASGWAIQGKVSDRSSDHTNPRATLGDNGP